MESPLAHVEIALRVLAAIVAGRHYDAADVTELHRITPDFASLPDDELACKVIKVALERRRHRAVGAG